MGWRNGDNDWAWGYAGSTRSDTIDILKDVNVEDVNISKYKKVFDTWVKNNTNIGYVEGIRFDHTKWNILPQEVRTAFSYLVNSIEGAKKLYNQLKQELDDKTIGTREPSKYLVTRKTKWANSDYIEELVFDINNLEITKKSFRQLEILDIVNKTHKYVYKTADGEHLFYQHANSLISDYVTGKLSKRRTTPEEVKVLFGLGIVNYSGTVYFNGETTEGMSNYHFIDSVKCPIPLGSSWKFDLDEMGEVLKEHYSFEIGETITLKEYVEERYGTLQRNPRYSKYEEVRQQLISDRYIEYIHGGTYCVSRINTLWVNGYTTMIDHEYQYHIYDKYSRDILASLTGEEITKTHYTPNSSNHLVEVDCGYFDINEIRYKLGVHEFVTLINRKDELVVVSWMVSSENHYKIVGKGCMEFFADYREVDVPKELIEQTLLNLGLKSKPTSTVKMVKTNEPEASLLPSKRSDKNLTTKDLAEAFANRGW